MDTVVAVDSSIGRNNVFALRNKFENLTTPTSTVDRRGTISIHPSHYPLETNTLGRKVARNSSFSFSTTSRTAGRSISDPVSSPVVHFPFLIRDRNGRYSNRSLQETSTYDSYTIATPPRKLRQLHISSTSSAHSSPSFSRKSKDKDKEKGSKEQMSVRLSPAQSLSSLSSPSPVSSTPSPLKSCAFLSSSVFNLAIEPSQCVSTDSVLSIVYLSSLVITIGYYLMHVVEKVWVIVFC